ncbi:hypothetical protein Rhe02_88820 [Rhizocola hellebori]|uniref:Nucleoside diphosphate kinase-like domain-containing protein n=1 Tax=Rhizocola hellebori TaxID=1392758 RepID=A0A8J3QH68_9ACTN|nr:hypothetical protein [Rhizocola hellebori]GIH10815.1 hypothetical protein Rhe02_88820 [Rhizocola hellebori]
MLTLPRRLELAAIGDPAVNRWPALTRLPEKAAYFSLDTYFRQALAELEAAWGGELAGRLRPLASILFRPDAVAGRRIPACLEFLAGHGFAPLAAVPLRLTRHMALELWRYQHNAGTLDRVAATEHLVAAGDSLYLLLLDRLGAPEVPATVRLRGLKGDGAGDPAGAAPTLRSTARIVNRILAMLHTPDEPLDLVRELGIFFDAAARARLIQLATGAQPLTAGWTSSVLEALHAANPPVDLDPQAALDRMRIRYGYVSEAEAGHFAASPQVVLPAWDRVLICSHYISYDTSDDMLIAGNGEAQWRLLAHEPA